MKVQILSVLLLALLITCITKPAYAQLGVGTLTPDPSAQLEVNSTEKGVLVSRMSTLQRTAIQTPADGLLVYDTDSKDFWYFKSGTGWAKVDSGPITLPYAGVVTSEDVPAFSATNQGNGVGGNFKVDKVLGTSAAVKGEVNTQFANFGAAGIYGIASGTGGFAGLFYSSNPGGSGPALLALTEGEGNGLTANAGKNGDGIEATADGTGNAVYGWIPNFGAGVAGRFSNFNAANSNTTVNIRNAGTGTALLANHVGPSGNLAVFQNNSVNVARINKSGVGYFNGGVQSSGADLAEAFEVADEISAYEPGDVLIISTEKDRAIEKSNDKYSSLVLGVYATKPGVLLTDQIDTETEINGRIPMGVVGVIPTKVCIEGGVIQRGDLLVTSSVRGVAMKADPEKVKPGQIIGKALQNFAGEKIDKINVFVNVK